MKERIAVLLIQGLRTVGAADRAHDPAKFAAERPEIMLRAIAKAETKQRRHRNFTRTLPSIPRSHRGRPPGDVPRRIARAGYGQGGRRK